MGESTRSNLKNIHNKIVSLVIIVLLLSVVVTSGPFYTLHANATLDVSNSTKMEFHAVALPPAPANATLTKSSPHVIFMPKLNNVLHKSMPGRSLAKLGINVGKTPGNDGYCVASGGCGQVTYHGGTVMHNARILIVFWVGGSFNDCSTSHYFEDSTNDPKATSPNDCSYMNLQVQFLKDICSDPFMKIAAQYTDGLGGAGPCSIATPPAGKFNPLVDTTAFPESTLTFTDFADEAQRMVNYMGVTFDGNTEVFVFIPASTPSCFSTAGSSCFGSAYCAYHGWESSGSTDIIFASMPDQVGGCGTSNRSPNSDPVADAEINPLSHELMESLTDPTAGNFNGGWYYVDGSHEIGDQCNGDIGTIFNADGSNIYLGTHGDPYVVQKEWSNSNVGCTLSEESLPASPTPPTGLMASTISSESLGLTWTGSTGATSYNIFRSTSSSGPFTTLAGSPVTTSFTDTGLSPNTTYYYKLTASNTGGTSAISSTPVSATTQTCTPPTSGDWTVASSCTVTASATAPANVIVQPGAVLTIPSGLKLTIDFTHYHLLVNAGGGVLINAGGAIN